MLLDENKFYRKNSSKVSPKAPDHGSNKSFSAQEWPEGRSILLEEIIVSFIILKSRKHLLQKTISSIGRDTTFLSANRATN